MSPTRTVEAEIALIGAGPCGLAAAWRLASAGRDVVLVERGDWFDYAAAGRDAPDWESRRAGALHQNPNRRKARDDEPIDDADCPIKPAIGNGIGGGSVHWSAHVPRFRPEDFFVRSLDGVGDDWPIAYEDLASHYALNEARLGVAGWAGDPSGPDVSEPRLALPTLGAHGRRVAAAFDRLGWHWWPVDLVVGRDADLPGTIRCTHPGPCDLGCPSRIRSGADDAYARDALAAGLRILARTRVLRLDQEGDRVTAARCRDEAGPVEVRAATFVLAANGMGTPHLLLRSADGRHPAGLANGSGLVGRNLMLHPYARLDGRFDEAVGAWATGEKAGLVSLAFYATDPSRGFARGLKLQLTGGPPPAALARGEVTGRALPWGAGHHAAFAGRFDHLCGLTVCAEDLPEPENRIALSEGVVDRDGLPAPRIVYRVSPNSRRALDFGLDRADEAMREAGARETFRTPLRTEAGFHIMGTCRMGLDPARSVVDPFGRCHDVPNLFLADASVFVTSAAVNPTATAQALALRTADHILASA